MTRCSEKERRAPLGDAYGLKDNRVSYAVSTPGGTVVGVTALVVVVTPIGPGTQTPLKAPGADVVPVETSWQGQAALQSPSAPVRHGWFWQAAQLAA